MDLCTTKAEENLSPEQSISDGNTETMSKIKLTLMKGQRQGTIGST